MSFPFWLPQDLSANMAWAGAVGILAGGLMLLFCGWWAYRVFLIAGGAALGALVGRAAAEAMGVSWPLPTIIVAAIGGLAMLLIEKAAIFILGGLLLSSVTLSLMLPALDIQPHRIWSHFGEIERSVRGGVAVAAGITFLIGGILSLAIWKKIVIVWFGILGGLLTVNGAVLVVEQARQGAGRSLAAEWPALLYVAAGVLAVFGMLHQFGEESKEEEAQTQA